MPFSLKARECAGSRAHVVRCYCYCLFGHHRLPTGPHARRWDGDQAEPAVGTLPEGERLNIVVISSEISPYSKVGILLASDDPHKPVRGRSLPSTWQPRLGSGLGSRSGSDNARRSKLTRVLCVLQSGGLADVANKLSAALSRIGHRVMTIAPMYKKFPGIVYPPPSVPLPRALPCVCRLLLVTELGGWV